MVQLQRTNMAVGFDGGGTKTDCVVAGANGHILGHGTAGPSNPLRVGFEAALKELAAAAAKALASAQITRHDVTGVCAGLAGAGRRTVIRRVLLFLSREFPNALARVTTDCEVALEAAVAAGPGLTVISGTGSSAFGRNAQGETLRAGGFGHWIGDEGSAYEMGRLAVFSVARGRDLGTPLTNLSERILSALACSAWEEVDDRIASHPDDVFPRLFPVIAAAAAEGDAPSCDILAASARALSNMSLIILRRLKMTDQELPIVKSGGVFGASPILDSIFDSEIASVAPLARISRLDIPPAIGAARLASRMAAEEFSGASEDAR